MGNAWGAGIVVKKLSAIVRCAVSLKGLVVDVRDIACQRLFDDIGALFPVCEDTS